MRYGWDGKEEIVANLLYIYPKYNMECPISPRGGGWETQLTKQYFSMSQIKEFIKQNEGRFLEDLFALIRIPSVSAQSEHKPDMQRCAEYWRDHLKKLGVQTVEI